MIPAVGRGPDFTHLRGKLRGISDRALDLHLEIYRGYEAQLAALEAQYPVVDWTRPTEGQAPPPPGVAKLLDRRIGDLRLQPEGILKEYLASTRQEMLAAGIGWFPNFYLGDSGMWTTDRATAVNVPWFLANPALWWLVNDRTSRYTPLEVERALRHEAGHALNYAYELWKRPDWTATFGDFEAPYLDTYVADPTSPDFVRYLHRTGDRHYAQKHPDEDWAETFAAWLDPRFDRSDLGAGAAEKLAYVDALASTGAFSGPPPNTDPGQTRPYRDIDQTVGQYLGEDRPGVVWSPHGELLRREPFLYNAVALHRTFFAGLGRTSALSHPGPYLSHLAGAAFGSVESWLLDLRAVAAATHGWALAAWDPVRGRLANFLVEDHRSGVPAGCPIVLAIDAWEHAWMPDYGVRKAAGIAAVFANVDWMRVEDTLARATHR